MTSTCGMGKTLVSLRDTLILYKIHDFISLSNNIYYLYQDYSDWIPYTVNSYVYKTLQVSKKTIQKVKVMRKTRKSKTVCIFSFFNLHQMHDIDNPYNYLKEPTILKSLLFLDTSLLMTSRYYICWRRNVK